MSHPSDGPLSSPHPDSTPPLPVSSALMLREFDAQLLDTGPGVAAADTMPSLAGRYEVRSLLGRGGMGEVYQGRDPTLGRELALKVLLAEQSLRPQAVERFREEAQIGGQLQHPGVVPVHELGRLDDGRPFFTMKLVKGQTLAQLLHERAQPDQERVRFLKTFEQVCQTMAYAHARGVIHRDLKPSNIMVGAFGEVLVLDWGLAKVLRRDSTEQASSVSSAQQTVSVVAVSRTDEVGDTREGDVLGTPAYMAPEQALGEIDRLDERCDVFSLGAVLCEILTGQPPYSGPDGAAVLRKARRGELPDSLTRLDHCGADAELIALAKHCLAPAREERPRDGAAVARTVEGYLTHVEERARRAEVERAAAEVRAATERRARRLTVSLVVAAFLLVVAGGVAASAVIIASALASGKKVAETARDEAKAAFAAADLQKQRAEAEHRRAEALVYFNQIALADQNWQQGNVAHARRILDATAEGFRCWEYRYLYGLAHNPEQTLFGHTGKVWSVAYSPDGLRLASASADRTVKLWDVSTGRILLSLNGHTAAVFSVAFSPTGRILASLDDADTIKLWDALSGREVRSLQGKGVGGFGLAFSPDGKRIASAGGAVWDADTGQQVLTVDIGPGHGVAFSPDGKSIVTVTVSKVQVWDAQTGKLTRTLGGAGSSYPSVAYSPNGVSLVAGTHQGVIEMYDARSGKLVRSIRGHRGEVWSLAFSPDGTALASGGADRLVKFWDTESGAEVHSLKGHTTQVNSVAFSPDGKCVAAGSGRSGERVPGEIKVWDVRYGQQPFTIRTGRRIHCMSFSSDGNRIALGGDSSTVTVCDGRTGDSQLLLEGQTKMVFGVAFSPDGKLIVLGGGESNDGRPGEAEVWDARTGRQLLHLRGHSDRVTTVCFSPEGRRIATGGDDGKVKVWDARSGRELLSLKGQTEGLNRVAFSPDGRRLAAAGEDGVVKVWNAESGTDQLTLRERAVGVLSTEFSPDGTQLLSAASDSTVTLWDAQTGEKRLSLQGRTKPPDRGLAWPAEWRWERACIASFTPDGKRIVTGARGSSIEVWDAQTGNPVLSLPRPAEGSTLAVSPDGWRIASGNEGHTVSVWDAPLETGCVVLRGHADLVRDVSFTPDGDRLVSRDNSGRTLVWDPASGQPVLEQCALPEPEIRFSPNGKLLALIDGQVIRLISPAPNAKQRERLELLAAPDLNWHHAVSERSEMAGDGFAAAFHLGRLLRHEPWNATWHLRRAWNLSRLNRPGEGVAHQLHALFLNPAEQWEPLWKRPKAGMVFDWRWLIQ